MILYNKRGATTAKALAETMGMRKVRDDRWKDRDGVPTIRWGSSMNIPNDTCTLNSARAIKIAADGIKSLDVLREAGVPVPNTYVVSSAEEIPSDVRLFARLKYHAAGQDIIDCPTHTDSLRAYHMFDRNFFSEFVHTDREIRLHVLGGKVVKGFRKVETDDVTNSIVRSSKNGWGYKVINFETFYPMAIPIALKAVEALGLTFGAVDMACTEDKETWVVWEVNTAPSLNTFTLGLYAEFLRKQLE